MQTLPSLWTQHWEASVNEVFNGAADDAEIEEEELAGVADATTEHEFSFKDFVLR